MIQWMAAFEFLSFFLQLKGSHFNVSQKDFFDFASFWLLVKRSKIPVLHCWPLRLAAGKPHSPAEETTVQTKSAATLTLRSCPDDSSSLVLSWTPLSHGHIPPGSKSADCPLMCPCLYQVMWFQRYFQTLMFCGVCTFRIKKGWCTWSYIIIITLKV